MRVGLNKFLVITVALFAGAPLAFAEVFEVTPGKGTVAAAAAKAKAGDTLKLAAGEYIGSIDLAEGVTLEGAGADVTTIVGDAMASINCQGPRVVIAKVSIKPGEKTRRGVNASSAVRVERCRFVGVDEAVALRGAPLSDVIACEFLDCGIGVRAIGEASPTVMGCLFSGGRMGVLSMSGMPYIRNNVFMKQDNGIRMVPGEEQAIIRNNFFGECKEAAVAILPAKGDLVGAPSMRNNVFHGCGAAATGNAAVLETTSHALVQGITAPAFRSETGAEVLKVGERNISEGDSGMKLGEAGQLKVTNAELLDGKGLRAAGDAKEHTPRIGVEAAWTVIGCRATAALPGERFREPILIANAVAEEYQYLRTLGLQLVQQSLETSDGYKIDKMSCKGPAGPVTLKFNISRFMGEAMIRP